MKQAREKLTNILSEVKKKHKGIVYADVRLARYEERDVQAANGTIRQISTTDRLSLGVRVIAEKSNYKANGFFGKMFGASALPKIENEINGAIYRAFERAIYNAQEKARIAKAFPDFAQSLANLDLAKIKPHQDTIRAKCLIDPIELPQSEITRTILDISKSVKALDPKIKFSSLDIYMARNKHLFANTEGSDIEQNYFVTETGCYVVATGSRNTQNLGDNTGHQRGWETVTKGVDDTLMPMPSFREFAHRLAMDAVELSECLTCPTKDDVTIVTEPHYNTLLVHEIIGHPTEADRALKMEAGYAGRSWMLGDTKKNQINKQIASKILSVYSDPTLEGLGHYIYDDEGTKAERLWIVKDGILQDFMNSRQTALILDSKPNASYFAIDAAQVPIIRMNNTVFANGKDDPKQIIKDVKDGFYVVGHHTPSIAESRENFMISGRKVFEIKNGQLGRLYANGSIMADSKAFLMNIDAMGNDFRMHPIAHCGKGQPMQTKRMYNGGPTLRSRGRMVGGN
ncbi:TldD/PmbA family protein [Elusimicrobiota bacterium]